MATYLPVTTIGTTSLVIVSQTSDSYNQIVNSLGVYNFKIFKIYISANSIEQIQQILEFSKKDANGEYKIEVNPVAVDPNQLQYAISIDVSNKNIILDGRMTLYLRILAEQSLFLYLTGSEVSPMDQLQKNSFIDNDPFFINLLNAGMKPNIDI